MSVTSRLSPRDRQLAAWFGRNGFHHPYLTVAALRRARIKPQTAAALLEKESGKGRNVFGHDHGSDLPDRPPYSGHKVTERRARKLYASPFANGVGPTQLTYKPYVARARRAGGEWKPYVNMVTGFRIFRELYEASGDSIPEAAERYNGSSKYGVDFARKRREWEVRLWRAGFEV